MVTELAHLQQLFVVRRRVLPVKSDGDEGEDTRGHRARRDELCEFAVDATERPVVVQQKDEVEHRVKDRDQSVGYGQIHQEVIGNCAHALVAEHDPDYDEIPAGGNRYHGGEHRYKRHLTSHDIQHHTVTPLTVHLLSH